ncbi:MAG: TetR/AcrR family transcriptional regulator [Ancalomicrobiaceae bacterium]|nr:TetR/AcrR family transcriptional regulator [Ancalomicrobiaceae bacterium]
MVASVATGGRPPVWTESERKAIILKAAERIFDEKGYGDATMEEVARAAGMAKKSVYRHFPDKFALFSALVESHDDILAERLPPMEALILTSKPRDSREQIRQMLFDLAAFVLSPRQLTLMRLVISEARKSPELAERFHRECVDGMLAVFLNKLDSESAAVQLAGREARALADMFIGAAIGPLHFRALMLHLDHDTLMRELSERVDLVTDLLIRSLSTTEPAVA